MVKYLIEEGLIDYVAIDIKIDQSQWLLLLQNKESFHPYLTTIHLLLNSSISYEFRTTLIKPYHSMTAFTSMLQLIQGAKAYYLQIYRPQVTLDRNFD
jgi:pyruvate formate lyase activating enzyme